MTRQEEGVIQFQLTHRVCAAGHYLELAGLIAWHRQVHALGLIGQEPTRYGGFAYGNMSHRLHDDEFLISGTQTGGLAILTAAHYAHVESCDITHNRVVSHGPIKPSSECMSHAAIYAACPAAMAVIHVHNPLLWQHYLALGLASTPADVGYGTPAMADAVAGCIERLESSGPACIAMLGHEDGIICFADNIDSAGQHLLALYEQGRTL
ncbi:class II aldolase/adducin family protein [Sulfuriflexus sp.]|uniref:class II aldolase/adducin family protein n=1 Tax=Sulfuriflexus sp. TaxID=2015443 RepID=UPI0028CF50A5|nr:class II aldolase/adducin family protein [Sulfuriflexus sp.]MDT8404915.1 class II aldolase/adducin family protein [Sulfuriflexus sp.]